MAFYSTVCLVPLYGGCVDCLCRYKCYELAVLRNLYSNNNTRWHKAEPMNNSQRKVYDMLRSGPCTNADFAQNYCLRYSARIHELKQMGHDITCKRVKGGTFRYTMKINDFKVDNEPIIINDKPCGNYEQQSLF